MVKTMSASNGTYCCNAECVYHTNMTCWTYATRTTWAEFAPVNVTTVCCCENVTKLTDEQWKYVKVPQKEFEASQPNRLSDLAALAPTLFDEP